MAVKTASFLSGLQPPGALEGQDLGLEQQQLLEALKQQQGNTSVPVTPGGRYNALNFDGLANSLLAHRTKSKLENNRRKQADLLGKGQATLLAELAKYDSTDIETVKRARTSPHAEIRSLAEDDLKAIRSRGDKLVDRVPVTDAARTEDYRQWGAKPNQKVVGDSIVNIPEQGSPVLTAGGWSTPAPDKTGAMVQTNSLTGEVRTVNRAPTVSVVNVNDKADAAGASEGVKAVLARADELSRTTTNQVRALASMEENSRRGAYQGPVQNWVQQAVGLGREFGLTSEETNRVLANTESLKSDAGRFVLSMIKQTGTNPSNSDRIYAEETAGGAKLSPQGLLRVIRAARVDLANNINEHNARVDVGAKTGVKSYELGRIRMPLWRKGDLEGFTPDAQNTYMPQVVAPAQAGPNMADYLPGGKFYGKP